MCVSGNSEYIRKRDDLLVRIAKFKTIFIWGNQKHRLGVNYSGVGRGGPRGPRPPILAA